MTDLQAKIQNAPDSSRVLWCLECGRVYLSVKGEGELLRAGKPWDCGSTLAIGTPAEALAALAITPDNPQPSVNQ